MADTYTIQFRRGMYADFDTSKIRPGEPVAILGNDPSVPSGKALYIAFAANDVRRLCSIEDISEMVNAGEFVGPRGPKGEKGDPGPKGDNMSDEQAAQIEQNKTDIASLKEETGLLKGDLNTLSLGVHTDGLIYVFVNGEPNGTGVKQGTSGDVVGYVDSENNIVLAGELAEGTYTLKYEMEDGSLIDIGELNLSVVNYTNLIPTSVTTDGVTIYNGIGYKNDVRLRTDGIEEATMSGQFATGFIPVVVGDIIRIKGATYNNSYTKIVGYDSSFANRTDAIYYYGWDGGTNWDIAESGGTLDCTLKSNNIAWARFTAVGDGANVIITRNEEIS